LEKLGYLGKMRLSEAGRASQVSVLRLAGRESTPPWAKIGDYISFLRKRENTQW